MDRRGEELREMRIEVDWELCDGQGVCAELAPTLFEVTDDDQVRVLDENPPLSMATAVAAAVRGCPKTALRLVE
jgi:ferredoxin